MLPDFVYLYNIPKSYHACHLRNFFSQFIESERFECFHFRHRPELILGYSPLSDAHVFEAIKLKKRNSAKYCAILSVTSGFAAELCVRYNETHWLAITPDELPLADICKIQRIYCTHPDGFFDLLEFKPPSLMPKGNVGTSTNHFFDLIKLCRLDCSTITKLNLKFDRPSTLKPYGEVPYRYNTGDGSEGAALIERPLSHSVRSQTGASILNSDDYEAYVQSKVEPVQNELPKKSNTQFEGSHVKSDLEEDDMPIEEPAEEWERFEALHDDPYKVERRDKANLRYEDKVELVWEKGGSGLVFHTDERIWRKLDPLRKEELFDEPASFDWDVDMEPYEQTSDLSFGPTPTGHWGFARDTVDLIHIQRVRENLDLPDSEKDNRSITRSAMIQETFATRLMKQMGWQPGMRLGPEKCPRGLLNPIQPNGPESTILTRPGLGYHGPPGQRAPLVRSQCKMRYIRTAFESNPDSEVTSNLLRRSDAHEVMKYRSVAADEIQKREPIETSYHPTNRTVILASHSTGSREGISFVRGGCIFNRGTNKSKVTSDSI